MQPAKEFRAAREAFQAMLSFVVCFCWWTIFFVFNKLHSTTRKLCGPLTQR